MALTNWDIFTIVNTVLNKDVEGRSMKTSEFQTLLNAQSQLLFAEKLGVPNEYARDVPLARFGVSKSRTIDQTLRPFLVTGTGVVTGGAYTFSQDVAYLLAINPSTISGRGFDEITDYEWGDRVGSEVVTPSESDPVFKWTGERAILISPSTITGISFSFYKHPANAVVASSQNSTTLLEEYDSGSSTELAWGDRQKVELAYRILRDAGVNIERQDAVQLGQMITKNE